VEKRFAKETMKHGGSGQLARQLSKEQTGVRLQLPGNRSLTRIQTRINYGLYQIGEV
jgi:hypothetical protein